MPPPKFIENEKKNVSLEYIPSTEELLLGHLTVHVSRGDVLLVLGHYKEVSVWYRVNDLCIGQMQPVHEGGYLPEERVVAYGFGFAASLWTLLDKVDSV